MSARASSSHAIAFGLVVTLLAGSLAIACGSSSDREMFPSDDGGPPAALPESGSAVEAGTDAQKVKPPFDPKEEPVTCTTTPCAVELVAGQSHFCARLNDGTVRCWGDNTRGSLGVDDAGTPADASVDAAWVAPRAGDLSGVTQLSAGGATTCALVGDGGVRCWGGNDQGQLGMSADAPAMDSDAHPTPVDVALTEGAVRVDVGPASACAVLTSGEPWCWGDNAWKQLARTTGSPVAPGRAEIGALDVARVVPASYSAFALSANGAITSWGAVANAEGSLAGRVGSINPDVSPLTLPLAPVIAFAVSSTSISPGISKPEGYEPPRGIGHACAVVQGDLHCWGDSRLGALGIGAPERVIQPRRIALKNETAWARQVAVSEELTCVRSTDATVECSGDNARGALGRDPAAVLNAVVFAPVETLTEPVVSVALSLRTACALEKSGRVECWGSNERGELGQGSRDRAAHFVPVPVRF